MGVVQGVLITCSLQGVDPYTYLVDFLPRVGQHPAKRAMELTPRVWKTLFVIRPLRSDLDRTRDPPSQQAETAQNGFVGPLAFEPVVAILSVCWPPDVAHAKQLVMLRSNIDRIY